MHASIFKHFLFSLFTVLLAVPSLAATPMAHSTSELLWDNWYTVTENGTPSSYYNEKVEIMGERIKIQVNTWKKDGQQIRIENLGAYAKNTTQLEPLLYNFRTTDAQGEKSLDGSILENGKVFSVKITHGSHTDNPIRAEMIPKLILSSFFPVWVNKNYKRINGVQPIEFHAILEDQITKEAQNVPVVTGTAYEMNPDDFSKDTKSRKIRVEFARAVFFWYITPKGDAIKILIPSAKQQVVKVSKEKAVTFLKP